MEMAKHLVPSVLEIVDPAKALSQGCIFFHDFLLPSFTNRQNFVISFLKIISKMSETEHAYSISVKYDVADLVWCVYSLNT